MKVLCYGVRDVEIPIFEQVNQSFGFELTLVADYLNSPETAALAKGYDAVILRGNCFATAEVLDRYKEWGVEYVLTRTVGVNHIDVAHAKALGLKTAYVPFYSPNAIAELAVTLAMMLLRNTAYTVQKTAQKDFRVDASMFSREIRNCKVGLVGIGRIGLTVAKLFKGLGAEILAYDAIPKEGVEDLVRQVSLDELLRESDIVSVHAPYIPAQGRFITRDFIAKMKDGAILINTARGELQDAQALLEAVSSGKLAGLGLDTLEGEGDFFFKDLRDQSLSDPLVEELVQLYPRVLITPHIGSYTDEAALNMIETSFQNLQEFMETGHSHNEIE